MKHIKLFEGHQYERIREALEDYFLELIDDGYYSGFSHNDTYSITVFNLYKKRLEFDEINKVLEVLQSDTNKIIGIQKRILSLDVELSVTTKVQFYVYTFYGTGEFETTSTLMPGIINYSKILNGAVDYYKNDDEINKLIMNKEDLEENGMIQKSVQYYFNIQIQQDIDYGAKSASSVLFKNSF